MILPIYLSPKQHADLISRLGVEPNKSAVVQIALIAYYASQDAEAVAADLLPELAARVEELDTNIVKLCGLIERWLDG